MDELDLPFEKGQIVEARSFIKGYRGAWFRCEITDIRHKDSGTYYFLRYLDFPDEKLKWTKVYQYAQPRRANDKRQLMVRPCFPPIRRQSQLPETISEMVVVVNDVWRVGDLADWWSDDCYWSGRLTEALENDKFKIELMPPPVGEGKIYKASSEDLRPTLNWSLEHGWTVASTMEINNHHSCARLIKPMNQGVSVNLTDHGVHGGRKNIEATVRASHEQNASFSSHVTTSSMPPLRRTEQKLKSPSNTTAAMDTDTRENIDLDATYGGFAKTSCSDSVSSSHVRGVAAEMVGNTGANNSHANDGPSKKMRADGGICLNSTSSDTIEAAILDLEELVNRVKWIKGILQLGMPSSNSARPSWKFLEHRGSSMPK